MELYINHNGHIIRATTPIVTAGNRSFRYGDGCFETMRFENGEIALWNYHCARLFHSLQTLQIKVPAHITSAFLYKEIIALAQKNKHPNIARIRLNIYRSEDGNNGLQYVIESFDFVDAQEKGLIIDIYPHGQKSCDMWANIKSNNYLIYSMASLWAKQNALDEAIVLNMYGRVADATIANIFMVKNGTTFTPPLTEGCVDGVMRRHLINQLAAQGNAVVEQPITIQDLQSAEEIFLTNALRGKITAQLCRNAP